MQKKQIQEIKKAQKESLLLRELSKLFLQITLDDPELKDLHISHVKLSPDNSMCSVFFYAPEGQKGFDERFAKLVLYKPSLRKALSQALALRHTPNLKFKYDKAVEKQRKVEALLDKIKTEDPL